MRTRRELDARIASADAMAESSRRRLAQARKHAAVSRRLSEENHFGSLIAGSLGLHGTSKGDGR